MSKASNLKTKHRRKPKLTAEQLEHRREERARKRATVRPLLYSREQTGAALGGVSVSYVIRLENDKKLSKVRLRGPMSQVFNRVEEVEALAARSES